jgi:hypothetical protein
LIEEPKPLPNSISEAVLGEAAASGQPVGAVRAPETRG